MLRCSGPAESADRFPPPRVQNEPYVMLVNESDRSLTGNARFEGFCIDLVNAIAELRHFRVRFVESGGYGGIDPVTGEASGMVKELMEQVCEPAAFHPSPSLPPFLRAAWSRS